MNRIFKTAILSAAVAATTLATLPAANAGERWRRHRHYQHSATAISRRRRARPCRRRADRRRCATRSRSITSRSMSARVRGRTATIRSLSPKQPRCRLCRRLRRHGAVDPDWYDYCSDRYRSFNAAHRHLHRL